MKSQLSYDDVLLLPQYSDIRSRAEIDISTDIGNDLLLNLPIVASPMDTISEAPMANMMSQHGGIAIIHRYNTIEEQVHELTLAHSLARHNPIQVGAAIGVTGNYLERAKSASTAGASFLCIDVAHGHHLLTKEALKALRKLLGDAYHLMAGNIATLEALNDLADWGANSVRCNIGGGSICSTRVQTGHGKPGLQTIFDCAQTDREVAIIADGGIRNSGDIVKALAAGAHAVMCGSLLSGTDETPGKVFEEANGSRWKDYRGMASKEAQVNWKGKYSSFEGVATRVPYRGSARSILADLEGGIRSGFSYSGARSLKEMHLKARFVQQTSAGQSESNTHILSREW